MSSIIYMVFLPSSKAEQEKLIRRWEAKGWTCYERNDDRAYFEHRGLVEFAECPDPRQPA